MRRVLNNNTFCIMKKFAFAALIASLSSIACAADVYVGAGFNQLNIDIDGGQSLNPTAINLIVGTEVTPNFAVEARLYTSLADDSIRVNNTTSVDIGLDHAEGVYAKGILPINEQVSAYGLLGYTNGALKASVGNTSVTSDDDSDVSYGAGMTFKVNKQVGINLEYARMFTGSDYHIDNIGASLTYRF